MFRRLSVPAAIFPSMVFSMIFAVALALTALGTLGANQLAAAADAGMPANGEVPPQVSQAITGAINSPDRPAADKQLDASRHPEQIVAFFGIAPGMKVADLWAGGGYTTELLARVVGPNGKVYSQNGPFPPAFKKGEEAWKARPQEPGMSNVVELSKPFDKPDDILPVPPESLDAVIIDMNYHDLVGRGYDRTKINAAVFRALKPGGVYGVIDNSAVAGSGARDAKTLHRIDEAFETNEIKQAGFRLAAASAVLRKLKDDRTWFVMKHRGEQDRFVLKFVKPPGAAGVGAGLPH